MAEASLRSRCNSQVTQPNCRRANPQGSPTAQPLNPIRSPIPAASSLSKKSPPSSVPERYVPSPQESRLQKQPEIGLTADHFIERFAPPFIGAALRQALVEGVLSLP
jgi:hypothetical protein